MIMMRMRPHSSSKSCGGKAAIDAGGAAAGCDECSMGHGRPQGGCGERLAANDAGIFEPFCDPAPDLESELEGQGKGSN